MTWISIDMLCSGHLIPILKKPHVPRAAQRGGLPSILGTGTYPSVSSEIRIGSEAFWTLGAGAYYEIHPAAVSSLHLQSLTANATANGSQRKLVRNPQSGVLHLTYESDGDIFTTRSTDNGATWSTEKCISRGYTDCSAPGPRPVIAVTPN